MELYTAQVGLLMKLKYGKQLLTIVGGSSEIGLTLAKYALQANLSLVLTYRNEQSKTLIEKELRNTNGAWRTVYLDLENKESIQNVCDTDYLVDLSHTRYEALVPIAKDREVEEYFVKNTIFKSLLIKHVTNSMRNRRFGRLLYISSTSAVKMNPGQGYYAASKLSVEALYKAVGIELGALGITSVILRPGYIDSGRGRSYIVKNKEKIKKAVPLKRAMEVEEICENIMFFLSDSSLYINSTAINIDGGMCECK